MSGMYKIVNDTKVFEVTFDPTICTESKLQKFYVVFFLWLVKSLENL